MFKIKDEDFNIKLKYMDAFVDENEKLLKFGLQIFGEAKENMFCGRVYDKRAFIGEPQFIAIELLEIKPNEIQKWQDIAGKIIEWKLPVKHFDLRPNFYVFEFKAVYNAKVEFINKNDTIFVKINAFCDINWNEEYSVNVPFEIETEINFSGISFGKKKTEKMCKEIIAPYLDINYLD
jgi:translation initiation factor IF-3